jgi:hypothetical protein
MAIGLYTGRNRLCCRVLELKNKFPNLHYFLNKKKINPNQRTKPESNPGRSQ